MLSCYRFYKAQVRVKDSPELSLNLLQYLYLLIQFDAQKELEVSLQLPSASLPRNVPPHETCLNVIHSPIKLLINYLLHKSIYLSW